MDSNKCSTSNNVAFGGKYKNCQIASDGQDHDPWIVNRRSIFSFYGSWIGDPFFYFMDRGSVIHFFILRIVDRRSIFIFTNRIVSNGSWITILPNTADCLGKGGRVLDRNLGWDAKKSIVIRHTERICNHQLGRWCYFYEHDSITRGSDTDESVVGYIAPYVQEQWQSWNLQI